MFKKTLFIMLALAFTMLSAQTMFTQWNFDTESFSPTTGTGSLTMIGEVAAPSTGQWAAGNPGRALNTSNYPAQGTNNETGGIQILTSTVGKTNIKLTWHQTGSAGGASRFRLQYTLDGSTWANFDANDANAINNSSSASDTGGFDNGLYVLSQANANTWFYREANLSAITGANDNPNFGVRLVSAFVSGTNQYSGTTPTGNYGTGGTARFDNITFYYTDENQVLTPTANPAGGTFSTTQNVVLNCLTPDATIYYTTNGADPTQQSTAYTSAIPISTTTTLKFRAYKQDMTPSIIVTENYVIVGNITCLADLRAENNVNNNFVYTLNFEVIVTHTQPGFRNQIYVQDATAGLLIDNPNGTQALPNVGDGLTGLTGRIALYQGLLQFTPTVDCGAPTSTGNTPVPVDITIDQMNNDTWTYQSNLVRLTNVWFTNNPPTNFANNQTYSITDGADIGKFQSLFSDADFVAQQMEIPTGVLNIVGLLNQRNDTYGCAITSRNIADITSSNKVATPTANPRGGYITMPTYVTLSCATEGATIRYTTNGTDPTETSTVSVGQFMIMPGTTLKFQAFKEGMEPSDIVTEYFSDTSVSDKLALSDHILKGNYPNPFNPTTTIAFEIKSPTTVEITVYNIKGQKVNTVTNNYYDIGNHTAIWNGTDESGNPVASGLYFYRMTTSETSQIKRAILMK